MKKHSTQIILGIFILLGIIALALAPSDIITDESLVNITAKGAFGKVHGKIPGIRGEILFNEKDLENSYFNVFLTSSNLNTKNRKRDRHLKSSDFLNVEDYPTFKFRSKKIEKSENGYTVHGDLTIKETTQSVSIPFTYENQANKGIFKGLFSINRKEYGVGGDSKLVGDKIDIDIVTAIKK